MIKNVSSIMGWLFLSTLFGCLLPFEEKMPIIDQNITHGSQLTPDHVGPGALGIASFVTVSGGICSGTNIYDRPHKVPEEWFTKGLTRITGPGPEVIDGYTFPEGTVVIQGANITSLVDVYGNIPGYGTADAVGVVFRGCKLRFGGNFNLYARPGNGMVVMVSYCDVGGKDSSAAEKQSDGFRGRGEVGKPYIIKRNYITNIANAGEVDSHLIIEENLAEHFSSFLGDHADGWQIGGGDSDIVLRRNKVRMDAQFGPTGAFSFFNDWAGISGNWGYENVLIEDNYLSGGSYSLYLPSNAYPVSNVKVKGNRWSTEFSIKCGLYGPVYPTNPMDPDSNGNQWTDNAWIDGPSAGAVIPIPGT